MTDPLPNQVALYSRLLQHGHPTVTKCDDEYKAKVISELPKA